jgi:site-specific DNA-cytosine methylase
MRRLEAIDLFAGAGGLSFTWRVIEATDYGVPQMRRRLFVVGTRGPRFSFPRPTHGPDAPMPQPGWPSVYSFASASASAVLASLVVVGSGP